MPFALIILLLQSMDLLYCVEYVKVIGAIPASDQICLYTDISDKPKP